MISTIVLDLDETLVTLCNQNESPDLCIIGENETLYAKVRPHFDKLITCCSINNIDIVIFTAANYDYALLMTEQLFAKYDKKPILILYDEHMTRITANGPIVSKELKTVSEKLGRSTKTMAAIDDWSLNFMREETGRVFYIEPFYPHHTDDALLEAIRFIEALL